MQLRQLPQIRRTNTERADARNRKPTRTHTKLRHSQVNAGKWKQTRTQTTNIYTNKHKFKCPDVVISLSLLSCEYIPKRPYHVYKVRSVGEPTMHLPSQSASTSGIQSQITRKSVSQQTIFGSSLSPVLNSFLIPRNERVHVAYCVINVTTPWVFLL